jgi:rubredoxin
MDRYRCSVCGYVYDPEAGEARKNVAPGTAFEDIPDPWSCPSCGAGRIRFRITKRP